MPATRYNFPGFKAWHSDRGGGDKVSFYCHDPNVAEYLNCFISSVYIFALQGGGGMTIYYDESLQAHEHVPSIPATYKYLEKERQWLLISTSDKNVAFLRLVKINLLYHGDI